MKPLSLVLRLTKAIISYILQPATVSLIYNGIYKEQDEGHLKKICIKCEI